MRLSFDLTDLVRMLFESAFRKHSKTISVWLVRCSSCFTEIHRLKSIEVASNLKPLKSNRSTRFQFFTSQWSCFSWCFSWCYEKNEKCVSAWTNGKLRSSKFEVHTRNSDSVRLHTLCESWCLWSCLWCSSCLCFFSGEREEVSAKVFENFQKGWKSKRSARLTCLCLEFHDGPGEFRENEMK